MRTAATRGEPVGDEPAAPSMGQRAARATLISIVGQGATLTVRLGSNVILTRLLFPEAFGILAVVNVVLIGLEMISDVGIHTSIIQHRREDRAFLNTAFTFQVLRGLLLFVLGVAAAPVAAWAYDEPLLWQLIPFAATTVVLSGFIPTKYTLLQRHMRLGRVLAINLSSQIVSVAVMITWAATYRNVWALASAAVVYQACRLLLGHLAVSGPRDTFQVERDAASSIFTFGKWIFLSTLVSFVAHRFDVLLGLGQFEGLEVLGVYSIAGNLAQMPNMLTGPVIGSVLLPALSESFRQNPKTLQQNFAKAAALLHPAVTFIMVSLSLLAPVFFDLLYDDRYAAATWLAQLSLIPVWFLIFQDAWVRALMAVGDTRAMAFSSVLRVVVTPFACLLGHQFFGIPGFIAGLAVGSCAGHLLLLYYLAKYELATHRLDLAFGLLTLSLGAAAAFAPRLIAASLTPEWSEALSFAVSLDALDKSKVIDLGPEAIVALLISPLFLGPLGGWLLWAWKNRGRAPR